MSFFKSLFGGGKSVPTRLPEMEGTEYSIVDMYVANSFTSDELTPIESARPPWTKEKQTKFFLQFTGQSFVFDGEIGSMLIHYFRVDRYLKGTVWAFLYKETPEKFIEYRKNWGERAEDVGIIKLDVRQDGETLVQVYKCNVPISQPCQWSNSGRRDPVEVAKLQYNASLDFQKNASETYN